MTSRLAASSAGESIAQHSEEATPPEALLDGVSPFQQIELGSLAALSATGAPLALALPTQPALWRATLVSPEPTEPPLDSTPLTTLAPTAASGFTASEASGLRTELLLALPSVSGETFTTGEDLGVRLNTALLLANDRTGNATPGGQAPLSVTAVGEARHGQVSLVTRTDEQGHSVTEVVFVPEENFHGQSRLCLHRDGCLGPVSHHTWATLWIEPLNDAPSLRAETIALDEDHPATIDAQALLANDHDVDHPHQDLRIVAVDNARHCSVVLDANGAIRLVPEADYFGPAGFTYTVSDGVGGFTVGSAHLDIAPVNDAPRLTGERIALDEDQLARFTATALLANDSDIDNAQTDLTLAGVAEAVGGTVQLQDGEIVFTPQLNFNGQASFGYTVSDGAGGLAQARVELDIRAVNDAPVVNDELLWGKHDVTYSFSAAALLANDTDVETPGALRIVGVQAATTAR